MEESFKLLTDFISKIPAIKKGIGTGIDDKGFGGLSFRLT